MSIVTTTTTTTRDENDEGEEHGASGGAAAGETTIRKLSVVRRRDEFKCDDDTAERLVTEISLMTVVRLSTQLIASNPHVIMCVRTQ